MLAPRNADDDIVEHKFLAHLFHSTFRFERTRRHDPEPNFSTDSEREQLGIFAESNSRGPEVDFPSRVSFLVDDAHSVYARGRQKKWRRRDRAIGELKAGRIPCRMRRALARFTLTRRALTRHALARLALCSALRLFPSSPPKRMHASANQFHFEQYAPLLHADNAH